MGKTGVIGREKRDEGGFGLIEVIVAMTLLSAVTLMSISPTMSALANHQRAKLAAIAENLGQARIEEIRSLPYADVGIVDGNPDGVLLASYPKPLQGIIFTVTTAVSYQGDFTGLDVVPQGGDGVQGFWDSGVNYKLVRVTVAPPKGLAAIPFETIVAPPNLAAHEGKSNIIVNVNKKEPAGSGSLAAWPSVWIIRGAEVEMSPTQGTQQSFAQVTPGGGTPWYARLGPSMSTVSESVSGWRIANASLVGPPPTDRADPGATTTGYISLDIYHPVTLSVPLVDGSGIPVPGGTVTLTNGAGVSATYDTADPEYTSPGVWSFSTFNGEPMQPGTYTIAVNVPGYGLEQRTESVPDSYPTTFADTESFTMAPIPTGTLQVTAYDRVAAATNAIRSNQVTISGGGLTTPLSLLTSSSGVVSQVVPTGTYTVTVSGTWGHTAQTFTNVLVTENTTTTRTATMLAGSGKGVLEFHNLPVTANFQYRTWSSRGGGSYSDLPPNASGRAGLVVTSTTYYDMAKRCSSGSIVGVVSKKRPSSDGNGATPPVYTYNPTGSGTTCSS